MPSKKINIFKKEVSLVTVNYFAAYIVESSPGVANKINQTINTLNKNGYIAEQVIMPFYGIHNFIEFIKKLIFSSSDIIILRNTFLMPLLFPVLIWKRLRGRVIIIDIPTPLTIYIHELRMREKSALSTAVRIGVLVGSFPWALYPANKVLQYANESAYFSFGIRRKMQLISNGINIDSVPLRNAIPPWPADTFVMIAVAVLAPWHAFDRVIKGIANYQNSSSEKNKVNIKLIIVGDGECRKLLEKLAEELGVDHCVDFAGFQTGSALNQYFDQAHVAIASIGLFRKGLNMASDLKSREYAARGLPFITAGDDIDFDPLPNFVFKIENADQPINIEAVIEWYSNLANNKLFYSEIRQYASERLDFNQKIPKLFECYSHKFKKN